MAQIADTHQGLPVVAKWVCVVGGCLLGLLPVAGSAAERPALSFSQALFLLAERNELLAAEQEVVARSQAELVDARSRRLPEAGVTATYLRLSDPVTLDMQPVRNYLHQLGADIPTSQLPNDIQLHDREFGRAAATMTLPLYTGGRIRAGIDAAQASLAASEATVDGVRAELQVLLVQRYFSQVLATQAYQVRAATVATLTEHLSRAQRLQEEGQVAQTEVLRARVALSEARAEQESARHQLHLAESALAALLASPASFELTSTLPEPPQLPLLAPLIEGAAQSNPSLRAAREQYSRAQAGARAARGEQLPTVALFAEHKLYNHNLDIMTSDWLVGVRMNWTLFGGGSARSRTQAAEVQAEEVSYRLAHGVRNIELLVRQQHSRMADALSRLEAYTDMQALAEESLRAQQRAFAAGMASSLDVVDAELAVQRVVLGALVARYDSLVAAAGLYEASGQPEQIQRLFAMENRYDDGI